MSNKAAKVALTSVVLATAFGVLLYSSLGDSLQYYKYVDEVMVEPAAWHGKNLQVHGIVATERSNLVISDVARLQQIGAGTASLRAR